MKEAEWMRFFAWLPVETESGWHWLSWVERRHTGSLSDTAISSCLFDRTGYWIYRDRICRD